MFLCREEVFVPLRNKGLVSGSGSGLAIIAVELITVGENEFSSEDRVSANIV